MSGDDWFLKKQAQLLQDLVDAKAITLELLENLTVLSRTFLQQATDNRIEIPNREAVTHLVRRAEALLQASGETIETVLDGRPRDKLTPYPLGGTPNRRSQHLKAFSGPAGFAFKLARVM